MHLDANSNQSSPNMDKCNKFLSPSPSDRAKTVVDAPIRALIRAFDPNVWSSCVSFGQGVSFFEPPPEWKNAIIDAVKSNNFSGYSPDEGSPDLRRNIACKLFKENKIVDFKNAESDKTCFDDRIIVTAGANQAFVNVISAICDVKDEILIFSPFYFNHEMAIRLLGCVPVISRTASPAYLPDMDDLRAKVLSSRGRVRAIVTISPNNPTGAVYPASLLKEINDFCKENGIWHVTDETYEYFVYSESSSSSVVRHVSPLSFEGASNVTISIFTMSKAFGIPGYRIGYVVVPSVVFADVLKAQDTFVICANSVSQHAASTIVSEIGSTWTEKHLSQLNQYREKLISTLTELGADCSGAFGSFYVFPKFRSNVSCDEFHERLVNEFSLFVLPGSTFGESMTGICSFRIAYGNLTPKVFETALQRLVEGIKTILLS